MTTGIYCIKTSSDSYIGASKNCEGRWLQHVGDLRRGSHTNRRLKEVFKREGFQGLKFEILEACSEPDLKIREDYWTGLLKPSLNIAKQSNMKAKTVRAVLKINHLIERESNEEIALCLGMTPRSVETLRHGTERGDWATLIKLRNWLSKKHGREIAIEELLRIED